MGKTSTSMLQKTHVDISVHSTGVRATWKTVYDKSTRGALLN